MSDKLVSEVTTGKMYKKVYIKSHHTILNYNDTHTNKDNALLRFKNYRQTTAMTILAAHHILIADQCNSIFKIILSKNNTI